MYLITYILMKSSWYRNESLSLNILNGFTYLINFYYQIYIFNLKNIIMLYEYKSQVYTRLYVRELNTRSPRP